MTRNESRRRRWVVLGFTLSCGACAVVTDAGEEELQHDGQGDGDGDDPSGGSSGNGGSVAVAESGGAPSSGGTESGGSPPSGGAGSGGTTSDSGGQSSGGASSGGASSGGAPGVGCVPEGTGGAGSEIFADDFEDGNLDAWTTSGGDWSIQSDGSNVISQSATANALQIAIADGICAADQSLEVRVKVTSFPGQSTSYVAAIFGRVESASTHYMLAIGSDGKLVMRKRVDSSSTSAQKVGNDVDLDLTTGTWYTLRFELVGNTLSGYLDGALRITATDSSIAAGSVGLGTTQSTAEFDDIYVEVP